MGAGKSSVGPLLSSLLRRSFLDLDSLLEREFGQTIPQVFSAPLLGEEAFRLKEKELLAKLLHARGRPAVIALGGGAILNPQTRASLQSQANVFYLAAPVPGLLWDRLQKEDGGGPAAQRPLARDREAFTRLYRKREPLYAETGIPVDCSPAPEEVAQKIAGLLLAQKPEVLSVSSAESSTLKTFRSRGELLRALPELVGDRRSLVLLDHALYAERPLLEEALGRRALIYQTQARGEAAKTLAELEGICAVLSQNSFDRSDWVIARGGGSLSDLGAMAAGLFKRGLNLLLSPTTLLASVDAAIGGKTAVNFQGGKNQLGLFYLPREVWLDGETLASLNWTLVAEGLTEAFKTGLLLDGALAELIFQEIESLLPVPTLAATGSEDPWSSDLPLLLHVAHRSATAKIKVASQDFREEKGIRDILNLGHTYGHAVESFGALAPIRVSHGRAVSLGLAVALGYSRKRLGLDPSFALRAQKLCLRLAGGEFPPFPPPEYAFSLLAQDKKIRAGALKFVVLPQVGAPQVIRLQPQEIVDAAQEVAAEAADWARTPYSAF
jgi:3-dehydroquinate synthetase/shikimate kinase